MTGGPACCQSTITLLAVSVRSAAAGTTDQHNLSRGIEFWSQTDPNQSWAEPRVATLHRDQPHMRRAFGTDIVSYSGVLSSKVWLSHVACRSRFARNWQRRRPPRTSHPSPVHAYCRPYEAVTIKKS